MIVPVYNEFATVDVLLRKIVKLPHPKQVIVVDDGSNDGTCEILERWSRIPGVEVLFQPVNLGKGAAIRRGLLEARGEFLIVQDADLECDPNDYVLLLRPLIAGHADLVLGSRYLRAGRPNVNLAFQWGVKALNFISRVLYGVRLTDEATCFKVARVSLFRQMDLRCERFEFCPEVIAKACRMNARIMEVPVSYCPRTSRDGKMIRLRVGVSAMSTLWRWRKWVPDLAASPTGLV